MAQRPTPLQARVSDAAAAGRRLRVADARARRRVEGSAGSPALDRILDLLERRRLSPTELRLLVALIDSERGVGDLVRTWNRSPAEIRRIGARLYMRGLLVWRFDERREETAFGITRAGLMTVRPLLTAANLAAAA